MIIFVYLLIVVNLLEYNLKEWIYFSFKTPTTFLKIIILNI